MIDIAIIGGGASGLAAAVCAAKASLNKKANLKIAIFEASDRIGKSILASGNGRCNFSNYHIIKDGSKEYNQPKFVNKVFKSCKNKTAEENLFVNSELSQTDVPAYQMFDYLGLSCYIDNNGWMFPYTKKASSVLDVFRYALKDLGVEINCNSKLIKIESNSNKNFLLIFENGIKISASKIIFSTGGNVFNKNFFINDYKKVKKILGPIKTNTKIIKKLDGTKATAKCLLINNKNVLCSQVGEVLFRKYGVSGICIFNVSRFVDKNQNHELVLDFDPENDFEILYDTLIERFETFSNGSSFISVDRLLAGMMLPNIAKAICEGASINASCIHLEDIEKLAHAIKNFKLEVVGIGDDKQCQVYRGGVKVDAINPATMEYQGQKNIFVTGEAIDVDGPCGGYNLHWAWTTGILAGLSSV